MAEIINAAPMVIDQGTNDLSTREVPLTPLNIPQHLPKVYVFAEKGPIGPTYVDFSNISLTQLYGDETFNLLNKYFNHQTVFLQDFAAGANNLVVHRIVPDDAKDVANVTMYLDVLPTQVPLYKKNLDGSLVIDSANQPVQDTDTAGNLLFVPGYKVKWVSAYESVPYGEFVPGQAVMRAGTQVDAVSGAQSQQFPLFQIPAKYVGEYGNKLAIRMFPALTSDIEPFPDYILSEMKNFPYYFQLLQVINPTTGKLKAITNTALITKTKFILEEGKLDINTEERTDLAHQINSGKAEYADPDETRLLGNIYIYKNNLNTVLTMMYNSEKIISDIHKDAVINTSELNIYAINIASFTNSTGSPYQSIKLVDDVDSIRFSKNTNVFLKGASDGTISDSVMDDLVAQDMELYNSNISEYNDLVMHPESIIYDSGFTLQTKKALAKFISRRKDTFVVLSTQAHDNPSQDLSSQYSVGVALKTTLELYPESSAFGTPVMRGLISIGSGELIASNYTKRVPLTYEIGHKASRYMGAANGAWKNGFAFDHAPNSIVTQLKNIDITWVPTSTRNNLWTVGINFVLNYKIRQQFFPAMKTVYENDTSVLNSFFTAVAISYLNKVEHAAWREFSGSISFTNAQLEDVVNKFVAAEVKDKFDGKFVIVPDCVVTERDNLRGFSWTLNVKLYANNMKTVMTAMVSAYRKSDLAA